ncbi:Retrotransposon-derived protein PEG10 [Rhizoctonia solani]|uniref:Retrotransposon-derived protein PEG10 n=1 Tax=Rhizoctonia solani TaxID=456999 RepID=A0A8H8SWH5_9AGAM|nr:Retrotransposon-derived protein PEG10 [Rhizoctonia solani]QRW20559.1 Retrotransposon-derived protein PEG10 [Rhizoctonia solani]
MATCSRTASQAQSPFDQGYMEPHLPTTTSVKLGKVSLECVTRLLLGLLGHVKWLKREIAKIKEAGVETQTNVKNISQTVDVVKDGLRSLQLQGPCTPEGPQPKTVEETPCPIPKTKPVGLSPIIPLLTTHDYTCYPPNLGLGQHATTCTGHVTVSRTVSRPPFWTKQLQAPVPITQPTLRRTVPLQVLSPPPSPRLQSPIGAPASYPPAPAAHYPALVKVDHPNAYTGKTGSEAKQWLTQMMAWTCLNLRMFPTNQETVEGFKLEFLAAFGNPDATRATKQKITTLTQSSTCADYITKFRTLAMELGWNNAALRGQFAQGLHWEVSRQIATHKQHPQTLLKLQNAALVIDNALCKEHASHPPRDNKSSKQTNPIRGTSTSQTTAGSRKLSNNPNFVLEEERNCLCTAGACIKCGKMGHKFAECRTGWKATPIEDKGKARETAKVGKDSKYQLGKE